MTSTSHAPPAPRPSEARTILLQLSGQVRHAREAFFTSASPENVHALRGALRRAADGICLLGACLPPSDAAWFGRELCWQARRLGKARDLDVLSGRLEAKHPYTGEFRPADLLISSVRANRDAMVERAKAELLSARAATLADSLEHVLLRALEAGEGRTPLGEAISGWLSEAVSAIGMKEKRLMALGRRGRHRLRRKVRTLRYNCEICGNGSPAQIQYIDALISLQTALGEMNDDAVCAQLRQSLGHCGDLDEVPGLEPSLARTRRRELKKAWRAFDALPLPDFAQGPPSETPSSARAKVAALQSLAPVS